MALLANQDIAISLETNQRATLKHQFKNQPETPYFDPEFICLTKSFFFIILDDFPAWNFFITFPIVSSCFSESVLNKNEIMNVLYGESCDPIETGRIGNCIGITINETSDSDTCLDRVTWRSVTQHLL